MGWPPSSRRFAYSGAVVITGIGTPCAACPEATAHSRPPATSALPASIRATSFTAMEPVATGMSSRVA
jgi:hypothetical protein